MDEIIKSAKNELVGLFKKVDLKKYREELSLFKVEGEKGIFEAFDSGLKIEYLLYDPNISFNSELLKKISDSGTKVFKAESSIFQKISDTRTPQGCAALCKMRDISFSKEKIKDLGLYVLLENLQDPGNVGAILRSANAFFASGVVLCENSCSVFSPKVVRAAAGAVCRGEIFEAKESLAVLSTFREKGYKILGTGLIKNATELQNYHKSEKQVLVIGNEGSGVKEETLDFCDEVLYIPMKDGAESLNAAVASSVLLWELKK